MGADFLSPVLLVVINNDDGNSHLCSFVISESCRLSKSPYLLYCICSLRSKQYLLWPPLEHEAWQGQKRPYYLGVCIKQEPQTKMAAEYRQVHKQRRREEWRVIGNGGVCGKPDCMPHWKVGQLFLSLYLPAVSIWEHRPNAARSSNILRGTKRPDTIYISQLLSDYNWIFLNIISIKQNTFEGWK